MTRNSTVVRGGLVVTAAEEAHADLLIEDGRIAALAANEKLRIQGLHLYTFNQVGVVEAWRQRMLAEADSLAR